MKTGSAIGGGSVSRGFNHLLNCLKKKRLVKKKMLVHSGVGMSAVLFGLLVTTNVARGDAFYVADTYRIAKIAANGVTTTYIAAPNFGLNDPLGMAIDRSGNLFVSNGAGNDIVKIAPNGTGASFIYTDIHVNGVATDASNNVYLAETLGNTILKVSPSGVPTVLTDQVNRPESLAVDAAGNVYSANHDGTVAKVTPGGFVSTIATGLISPDGIALNGNGNIYVSDFGNNSISKIAPDGTISIFASGLSSPHGIVFGSNGDLYVVNGGNVSEITPNGVVTPFASGFVSQSGDIVVQSVPEPSMVMLFSGVGVGLLRRSRRSRRHR